MDIVPAKCCLKAQTHPIISVCPGKESALKAFFEFRMQSVQRVAVKRGDLIANSAKVGHH